MRYYELYAADVNSEFFKLLCHVPHSQEKPMILNRNGPLFPLSEMVSSYTHDVPRSDIVTEVTS
jgi:hypothetical protein